ncbi:MAG: SpoIID/LytB domain-containing protein [Bacteroidales bacterium]|nr:SpoIID/LytB domain-containing protein [Bacteroidales bacterium]
MKFLKTILLILFTVLSLTLSAEKINVRIYADKQIKEASFVSSFGRYTIKLGDEEISIQKTDIVKIKAKAEKVELQINDSLIGNYKTINFLTQGLMNFFLISPKENGVPERRYDDNLIVSNEKGHLKLINNIEIESYIAGVVQAETWGATKNVDFFKLQAICVRNYLFMNLSKHQKDGYHMCDGVHCQAYKGRANQVEVIQGAHNSKSEVVVDSMGNLIETLFHANSGGQTVNAEDVWKNSFSHLIGKQDTFSVGMKAYEWEKYIRLRDWRNYFREKGVNIKDDSVKNELINFSQKDGRKKTMLGVPLVQIRKDFGLRSTFFDIQPWGGEVKLSGKGYGHGVGMSQEGAINMCDQGYEYWQVLEFYYTGAKIKRLDAEKILNETN